MSGPSKFAEMAQVIDDAVAHHRQYRELDVEWLTETARQLRAMDAPVDWPARFRAAAEVADAGEPTPLPGTACVLRQLAEVADPRATWRQTVEAIGRALLGETEHSR